MGPLGRTVRALEETTEWLYKDPKATSLLSTSFKLLMIIAVPISKYEMIIVVSPVAAQDIFAQP